MTLETLWQQSSSGRRVTCSTAPSAPTVNLLSATIWGSRYTKYRILDIQSKLNRLRDPVFFVLSEYDRELCVFVLDKCRKRVAGIYCEAYHFVMASTVPDRQNEGLAGLLIEHVRSFCLRSVKHPGLGFAYVEETTEFSLRLSEQIGHSVETLLPVTFFTRLFPSRHPDVDRLLATEEITLRYKLEDFYIDHELTDFEESIRQPECFVIRRQGELIAALQVEVLRWSIVSLPGALGAVLLWIFSHFPFSNRLLNLKDLRLLRISNLFFERGEESALLKLLETCLFEHQSKAAMIMMDARSSALKSIQEKGKLGILSTAVSSSAKLRIDVVGMNNEVLQRLKEQPLMVSAGDVF